VVGDHWFEWADQPPGGRFDGEDNNFGLVSNADEAYAVFTNSVTAVHAEAPDRLADPRARCGAWERAGRSHKVRCRERLAG
jgi:agarase